MPLSEAMYDIDLHNYTVTAHILLLAILTYNRLNQHWSVLVDNDTGSLSTEGDNSILHVNAVESEIQYICCFKSDCSSLTEQTEETACSFALIKG